MADKNSLEMSQRNQQISLQAEVRGDGNSELRPMVSQQDDAPFVRPYYPSADHSGPWRDHELSSMETPVLRFLPSAYFACRNAIVAPFNALLFRVFGIDFTIGGILLWLAVLTVTAVLLGTLRTSAITLGWLASIPLIFTFALASHNNVFTVLFGESYERVLTLHKAIAPIAVGAGIFHGAWSYYHLDISKGSGTGLALVCVMGFNLINSFWPLRRYCYYLFYLMHAVTAIAVCVLALVHGAGIAYIGIGLWLADLAMRFLLMLYNRNATHSVDLTLMSPDLLRVSFANPGGTFRHAPGQYCFLKLWQVVWWEKPHPFSIASAPGAPRVVFLIKREGRWTSRLFAYAANHSQASALIDGPYGSPSIDAESGKYHVFAFVAGGIGVTALKPGCEYLLAEARRGRPVKRILFVWSVRQMSTFTGVTADPGDVLREAAAHPLLDFRLYLTASALPPPSPFTTTGRPPLSVLLRELGATAIASGETRVAVFSCGPAALLDDVVSAAREAGRATNVSFDIHSERFEF